MRRKAADEVKAKSIRQSTRLNEMSGAFLCQCVKATCPSKLTLKKKVVLSVLEHISAEIN